MLQPLCSTEEVGRVLGGSQAPGQPRLQGPVGDLSWGWGRRLGCLVSMGGGAREPCGSRGQPEVRVQEAMTRGQPPLPPARPQGDPGPSSEQCCYQEHWLEGTPTGT